MALTLRGLAELCNEEADEAGQGTETGVYDDGEFVLWQYLQREHIAPDATVEQWNAFVKAYETSFAADVTTMAKQVWDDEGSMFDAEGNEKDDEDDEDDLTDDNTTN